MALLNLPILGFRLPDASTNNGAPRRLSYKGSNGPPAGFGDYLSFTADADQYAWQSIQLPDNYSSGGTLRFIWACNATTGDGIWQGSLAAVTAGTDNVTYLAKAQSSFVTVTTAARTTARYLQESTLNLNMDSAAALDWVRFVVGRNGANASDTVAVDLELLSVAFGYTAS